MRAIVQNPLTASRDAVDRASLCAVFLELAPADEDRVLALRPYLDSRPQKFFDRVSYQCLADWLKARDAVTPDELRVYLDKAEPELSRAFLFLREINGAPWHEEIEDSGGEFDLVRFIDRTINPAYLRLVEGVLIPLVRVVAYFSRVDRGAGTDGLDVWQVVEELRRGPTMVLAAPYRHVVRNGIAHGGVTYLQNAIRYRDKKGGEETVPNREIVRTTDDLLDVCNGAAAALKVFFIANHSRGYRLPRELLIEELREETKTPWWTVEGCVECDLGNRTQLLVYTRTDSRDYNKVQFSAIQTGILAESLVPGYDRYFLSLRSPVGWPGWVGFYGDRLKAVRESTPADVAAYKGVVENDLVFYVPRRPLGRITRKLDTYRHVFAIAWPQAVRDLREQLGRPAIECRRAQIHRNAWGLVLDGSVVIEGVQDKDMADHVRRSRRRIIRAARRVATLAEGSIPFVRHLPIAFAQVAVFRRDFRARRLNGFGLGEDFVCTVRFQRMGRIRSPDIMGSTVEVSGRWRIAWNKGWLES